jgi:hypothetical protein
MTVTALVNPNTWILVEQNGTCAEGTVQDLQTGRPAAVAGMTTNQRGVVNARAIAQCRAGVTDVGNGKDLPANPAQGNGRERVKQELAKHAAAGTVKSVSGGTLTVTTLKGQDVTVNTNANTVVLNNGFVAVSSLKAGDKIELFGRPEKATGSTATRTITAWGIRVDNGTTKVMIGHVDSVSGNTLTLRTPKDRAGVQVTLGSKTGYKSVSVANQQVTIANASQADVKAGSNLIVEAVPSADGKSYTANAVILLPAGKVK